MANYLANFSVCILKHCSQVHNKWGGVKINGGGFKDFEKLLNRGGQNKRGGADKI